MVKNWVGFSSFLLQGSCEVLEAPPFEQAFTTGTRTLSDHAPGFQGLNFRGRPVRVAVMEVSFYFATYDTVQYM